MLQVCVNNYVFCQLFVVAMLTWINLARTLNESVAQSKDRLQKLTLVDPLRRGYYQDRITI